MIEKIKDFFSGKEEAPPKAAQQINFFDIDDAIAKKEAELAGTYNLRFWKPKKSGEQISGEVLERGFTKSNYGQQEYIKIKDGTHVYQVFITAVLARQIEEEDIQPGCICGIRFLGTRQSAQGKQYKNYILINAQNIEKEVLD